LNFVRRSSYQLSPKFSRDLLRLSKKFSVHDAIKAGSEIFKTTGEPAMADGVYPMIQLLDEEYLDVDAEIGGIDQRKTFALANDTMGKMGLETRAHLMNPMVPGLAGGKMSSSDPKSKIDLVDDVATIRKKVAKAYCAPDEVQGNGILAFIQRVIVPFSVLQALDGVPSIKVILKGQSENTIVNPFPAVTAAYESGSLTPQLAKKIVEEGLIRLTEPIRRQFEAGEEWQAIYREVYPSPVAPKKGTTQMQRKAEKESKKAAARVMR
jgi:tyrosyl-tRNA synthetase